MLAKNFPPSKTVAWLALATVFLTVYFTFQRVRFAGFVNYDDPVYVSKVPQITQGLSAEGLRWALSSTDVFWIPAVRVSYLFDYQIAGLDPARFHTTNLWLHAASAALVFLLFWRMTGRAGPSLALALLFAVHPLRVESVAWIAERRDVLSVFFALVTLHAYVAYAARPNWWRYALIGLSFALTLMSKAMLVTLPVVFLLLDYWPLNRWAFPNSAATNREKLAGGRFRTLLLEKVPFLLMSCAVGLLTVHTQVNAGTKLSAVQIPVGARLATAVVNYCRYLGKMAWPERLAVFYPHPYYPPPGQGIPPVEWLAGLAILGLASCAVILIRHRAKYCFFGWWWFCVTLVPVIGLIQVGTQSIADRYTYFPSLGLGAALVFGVDALTAQHPVRRQITVALFVALLGALIAVTRVQITYWQDTQVLFEHAVQVTEPNVEMSYNLGCEYLRLEQWPAAQAQFENALKVYPFHLPSKLNLAFTFEKQGLFDEAVKQLESAVQIDPQYAKAYLNLGVLYRKRGDILLAIRMYEKAIEVQPAYVGAYYDLGCAYELLGRPAEALAAFTHATRLAPDFVPALDRLQELRDQMSAIRANPPR